MASTDHVLRHDLADLAAAYAAESFDTSPDEAYAFRSEGDREPIAAPHE